MTVHDAPVPRRWPLQESAVSVNTAGPVSVMLTAVDTGPPVLVRVNTWDAVSPGLMVRNL